MTTGEQTDEDLKRPPCHRRKLLGGCESTSPRWKAAFPWGGLGYSAPMRVGLQMKAAISIF